MKINKILLPALLLLPFCLISDWLIHQHLFFKQEYWGLYDNFVHGVIAVLVLFPFFKNISYKQIITVFLIASLLDVDHFAVNFSFSLTKAISLTMRPPTHSITFAVAAASLVFPFSKKWSWIVFAAIASHVVRDAYGGGTPIFYPAKISMIPYWSYLAVEYLLLITSQIIGGNRNK
jgi:hypothetical protein